MNPATSASFPNFQNKEAYVTPIALGYVYIETEQRLFLFLTIIALFAAIVLSGLRTSIYGDESDENIDAHRTFYRRLQAAIWDAQDADKYPSVKEILDSADSGKEIDYNYDRSRLWVAIVCLLSVVSLFVSTFIVIWKLWSILPEAGFIPMILLFGVTVPPLRRVIWKMWPSIHQREDIEATSEVLEVHGSMDQLSYAVNNYNGLTATEISYDIVGGGVVNLEYETEIEFQETQTRQLEIIAFGFTALVNNTIFPINKLEVEFTGPKERGSFTVYRDWVDDLHNRKISRTEFMGKVNETVSFPQRNEAGISKR